MSDLVPGTDGSNNSYSNYVNVQTYGFDEGIQVGGEHVVCINCGATGGRYGFTFGNYPPNCGGNHPLTLGKMVLCIDPEKRKWVDFNAARSDVSDPVSPQSKRRPPREGAFFGRRHRLPIRSQ